MGRAMSIDAVFALVILPPACGMTLLVSKLAFATRAIMRLLNRAAPFRFAFLSAFSVPRAKHPRPSDARSPSQNPLRASARCGLLPPGKLWSPSADSIQSPREWVATAHPLGNVWSATRLQAKRLL
jgi:hypothetical protein